MTPTHNPTLQALIDALRPILPLPGMWSVSSEERSCVFVIGAVLGRVSRVELDDFRDLVIGKIATACRLRGWMIQIGAPKFGSPPEVAIWRGPTYEERHVNEGTGVLSVCFAMQKALDAERRTRIHAHQRKDRHAERTEDDRK